MHGRRTLLCLASIAVGVLLERGFNAAPHGLTSEGAPSSDACSVRILEVDSSFGHLVRVAAALQILEQQLAAPLVEQFDAFFSTGEGTLAVLALVHGVEPREILRRGMEHAVTPACTGSNDQGEETWLACAFANASFSTEPSRVWVEALVGNLTNSSKEKELPFFSTAFTDLSSGRPALAHSWQGEDPVAASKKPKGHVHEAESASAQPLDGMVRVDWHRSFYDSEAARDATCPAHIAMVDAALAASSLPLIHEPHSVADEAAAVQQKHHRPGMPPPGPPCGKLCVDSMSVGAGPDWLEQQLLLSLWTALRSKSAARGACGAPTSIHRVVIRARSTLRSEANSPMQRRPAPTGPSELQRHTDALSRFFQGHEGNPSAAYAMQIAPTLLRGVWLPGELARRSLDAVHRWSLGRPQPTEMVSEVVITLERPPLLQAGVATEDGLLSGAREALDGSTSYVGGVPSSWKSALAALS